MGDMNTSDPGSVPIAEARANLTHLANRAQLQRRGFWLTRRGKRIAALVPAELWEAAQAAGGADQAAELLRKALDPSGDAPRRDRGLVDH